MTAPALALRMGGVVRAGRRWLLEPDPPLVAIEIRPSSAGAVRLAREGGRVRLAAAASVELPLGTTTVSLTQPNVIDPTAFEECLRRLLERVGSMGGGRVALVLPDPVVRLALVDLAEKAGRGTGGLEEEIRFRLRKSVPFDTRDARIAFIRGVGPGKQTVVGLVLRTVLEGYEQVLERLGCEVGLVEPACLALASWKLADEGIGDELLVNWDEGYISLIVARAGWPILLRTLSGGFVTSSEAVEREATATLNYYRERLEGSSPVRVYLRCAERETAGAMAAIGRSTSVTPELIDPWTPLGAMGDGALGQAVAAGAAVLLREVA